MGRKRTVLGVIGVTALGVGLYRYRRSLIGKAVGLSPARYAVEVTRSVQVPADGGIGLATDLYMPKGSRLLPTILIRTPYGRGRSVGLAGIMADFFAQRFAERGYNVVIQDVRGRFESEGDFHPFQHEAADGRATLEWLENQPWFNGVLGTWGESYLGYVQWSLAGRAPLYLKAMLPSVTSSRLADNFRRSGALELDTTLRWISKLDGMDRAGRLAGLRGAARLNPLVEDRLLADAFSHLPVSEADEKAVGHPVPFYKDWLDHPGTADEYWTRMDHQLKLPSLAAAVHLVGGWYDIFLDGLLDDYGVLKQAGRQPYLTIGPWNHLDMEHSLEALRQGLVWFDAHLKGDRRGLRPDPVQVYLMGAESWITFAAWPPQARRQEYFLHPQGRLAAEAPQNESAHSTYVYDPHHPTPAVGGPLLSRHSGPADNRELEARPDVLTFTGPPLETDLDVVGPVGVELFVHSDRPSIDFFARLCDVHPDGRSINICDGLVRIRLDQVERRPDGSYRIEVPMSRTAMRFMRGHRLRLQVSSGAHPRWDRNPGILEPARSEADLYPARQTVFHDWAHPSRLIVPVVDTA